MVLIDLLMNYYQNFIIFRNFLCRLQFISLKFIEYPCYQMLRECNRNRSLCLDLLLHLKTVQLLNSELVRIRFIAFFEGFSQEEIICLSEGIEAIVGSA